MSTDSTEVKVRFDRTIFRCGARVTYGPLSGGRTCPCMVSIALMDDGGVEPKGIEVTAVSVVRHTRVHYREIMYDDSRRFPTLRIPWSRGESLGPIIGPV